MKIKAFEITKEDNVVQYNKGCFADIYIEIGNHNQRLTYSEDGKVGMSLEQAQKILAVLGVELYEDKEINTFEEFRLFLSNRGLVYDVSSTGKEFFIKGNIYSDCIEGKWKHVSEVEKEYDVKLNILRGNE